MARTIAQILASMDAEQAAQANLSGLNSTSQTAIYTLWKYITAASQYVLEVLIDTKKTEIENVLKNNVIGSEFWIRTKVFEFQYDAITPQVITLVNGVPTYPVIDTTKRIITRCSVKTTGLGDVSIKVAKSEPPAILLAAETNALQAYFSAGGDPSGGQMGIGMAGTTYNVYSYEADRLYIKCELFYDGTYASTISDDTVAALEAYMAALPFDGAVKVIDVVNALEGVPGFKDVFINEISIRADGVAFGSRTKLVDADTLMDNSVDTTAGYLVEEDTATYTFTDKITFTAV